MPKSGKRTHGKRAQYTWLRVMGRSLPVGGPGRLPPRVRDENALLYISFHRPWSLSRSAERSTSPPTSSTAFAAASAFCRSSSLAASPLFRPETALCDCQEMLCFNDRYFFWHIKLDIEGLKLITSTPYACQLLLASTIQNLHKLIGERD